MVFAVLIAVCPLAYARGRESTTLLAKQTDSEA